MKKNYLLISFFVLAGLCFSATAQNYDKSSYDLSADEKTLVKWNGDETEIDFTKDEKLKEIVTIGEKAFSGKKITDIVIGDKVEVVGKMAFYVCKELKTVKFGNSVKVVEQEAFSNCIALEEISLPASVEKIGVAAFTNCEIMKAVVFEGNNLKEIQENAFSTCLKVGAYNFPESLEIIGTTAFYDNKELKSISLPTSLKTFGANPFSRCDKLESIEIAAENEFFLSLNGAIYSKDQTVLLAYPAGKTDESFDIPEGVTTIEVGIFLLNNHIKKMTLPESLTDVKKQAFKDMMLLEAIVFPNSLTYLTDDVLDGCEALKTVELGINLKTINGGALKRCVSLNKIISKNPTPPTLENEYVFYNTENVKELIVPEGSQQRYKLAKFWKKFVDESKDIKVVDTKGDEVTPHDYPTDSYTLSDGGKTLEEWTGPETEIDFNRDSKLKELTKIGGGAFAEVQDDVKTIIIGDKVEVIEAAAFQMCTKLEIVKIGNAVKFIEDWAFSDCTSLTDISIPASVEKIGESAFIMCEVVETLVFEGDKLKEIGEQAFNNCEKIKSVKLPESLETIGTKAFYGCKMLSSINLPKALKSIGDSPFLLCEKLSTLEIDDSNEHYVTSGGVLYTKDKSKLVAYPAAKKSKKFVMPEEVQYIPVQAFIYNARIQEMTIQEGLTEMGEEAFYSVKELKKIVLPNSLTKIPYGAFKESEKLESVELGNKVDFIDAAAFSGCEVLKTLISKNPNPPTLGNEYVFDKVKDLKIFVPKGSKVKYENDPIWKKVIEGNTTITVVEDGSLPSSVVNVKAQKKFRLFVNASVLSIDNVEPGVNITIYSISGQQIFNQKASSVREEIVLNPGMYIVKVSDVSEKIIVR